ncbi:MAG TPA: hypothetical protein VMU95_41260 [Trebonia sp.]|nr:hypothetical protein [Trebonia sp.]
MPMPPRSWIPGSFVSAKYLNNDLYSYVPYNNHAPNGVLYHAFPPLKSGWINATGMTVTSSAAAGGSTTNVSDTGTTNHWGTYVNNEALYYGGVGVYQGTALGNTPGADGSISLGSGTYLEFSHLGITAVTNATGYVSAGLFNNLLSSSTRGGSQLGSTAQQNVAYCLDLLTTTPSSPICISLQSIVQDSSANSYAAQANSIPVSTSCRLGYLWIGLGTSSITPAVISPVPTPSTTWSLASSVNLNQYVSNTLSFLNNRPQLRVTGNQTGSVAVSTLTALNPSSATTDNYSGYSPSTHKYTVPVPGVYLVHLMSEFSDATAGQRRVGVQINGSLNLYGPAHSSASGSGFIRPQMTRLLDLNAGDTIQGVCTTLTNSGTLSGIGNMLVVWMGNQSSVSNLAFTPPDVTFRWTAGVEDAALLAQFDQHLGNDLNFLLNRPYFLGYQTTAQTSLPNGTQEILQMQSATGRVHGTVGDNYGGWTSGASNHYTAQVAGWYLVVTGGSQVPGTTVPYVCSAGFGLQNSLGDVIPVTTLQQQSSTNNGGTTLPPGADGLDLTYLAVGDEVWPSYEQLNGASTYATSVVTGCESHFELIWVSE